MLLYGPVMTMDSLEIMLPRKPRLYRTAKGFVVVQRPDLTIHIPLTIIRNRIAVRLTAATADLYIRHFLKFEEFLSLSNTPWDASPDIIREATRLYLRHHNSQLNFRQDRWHVYTNDTGGGLSVQTLRTRLEGIRAVYTEAIKRQLYLYDENPFVYTASDEVTNSAANKPPSWSGLADEYQTRREPEQFWILETGHWSPKHLLDPAGFFNRVMKALEHARQRDQCIVRILGEGGPRVSEACSLTLEGWNRTVQGRPVFHNSFMLRNKGYGTEPSKLVHVDDTTGLLLRQYFMEERRTVDPLTPEFTAWYQARGGLEDTPENYYAFLRATNRSPADVPLFLNRDGKAYTANAFRKGAWRPLLAAAGIKARPHQLRHAFVTCVMDQIEEAYSGDSEALKQARRALGTYMKWRQPARTLLSYDHSRKDERVLIELTRVSNRARELQAKKVHAAAPEPTEPERRVSRLERRRERMKGVG